MDREQDKFYEDENNPVEDRLTASENSDEVNDMQYFGELLRHLRDAIEIGKLVPLTNKKMVEWEKCLMIIDDLENNLPDAIQYGLQMYEERDRILGNAEQAAMKRVSSAEMHANAAKERAFNEARQRLAEAQSEADAIISDAQDRADHMVDNDEIVRRAREEARIIKNDARVEASELKLKATHEAYQLLSGVEEELTGALNIVRRRRAELGDEAQ